MKSTLALVLQSIYRRKNQSVLLITVLTISFAFAFIVLGYSYSVAATNEQYRADTYGSWYGMLANSNSETIEYVESTDWLNKSGTITTVGTVSGSNIGTLSESMTDMGISMNSGRLPKNDNEIAIEADVLSGLGYDYELGQEITITVNVDTDVAGQSAIVSETFTLCGIIKEYTSIWSAVGTTANLNSAVITEDAMNNLLAKANEYVSTMYPDEGITVSEPETTLFFTVKSGYENEASSDSYLRKAIINYTVSATNEETSFNILYVAIIFAVSLLAVVVVYVLNMQKEVERTVRMRSIGASKRQVLSLVALETLIICVPAIILGTAFGVAGMWLLLKFGMYSGSVNIVVNLPVRILLSAGLIWILGVLIVRAITFATVLSTPLTGHMTMSVSGKKKAQTFQRILVCALSLILCFVVVFTSMNVIQPSYTYDSVSSSWSYMVSPAYTVPTVTDDVVDLILSVPGITDVQSSSTQDVTYVKFESAEVDSVQLYVIDDPTDWHSENSLVSFDFSDLDIDSFMNGDSVMFAVVSHDELITPEVGDSLTIGFDLYSCSTSNDYYFLNEGTATQQSEITTTISGISVKKLTSDNSDALDYSYYIVCSTAFLQKLIDMIPEGYCLTNESLSSRTITYVSGEEAGYWASYIYTDSNAEFLSTDAVLASIASNAGLSMLSVREYNYATAQNWLQQLILVSVSGSCIVLVVLLILISTINLESQQEKKKYGILRAIGMSKYQQRLAFLKQALFRAIPAVVIAWGSYLGYYVYTQRSSFSEGETVLTVISRYFENLTKYTNLTILIPMITVVMLVMVILVCFIPKRKLNRYTLMEMLHDE